MAYCKSCKREFKDDHALKQRLRISAAHSHRYRPTTRGSNHALARRKSSSKFIRPDSTVDIASHALAAYSGEEPSSVKSVFNLARQMRRRLPSTKIIIARTGTKLNPAIVSALMTAAERLNSLYEDPDEARDRPAYRRLRSKLAQVEEDAFAQQLKSKGYVCLRESDQRHPVTVGGQLCSWLEFKDYFGFPNNPFVARSERKLGKYAIALGPGAVILSHGFQRGHPNVDMVRAFRTEDILHELPILNLATGTTNSREQLDHELQLESSDSLEADERPQEHSLCMMLADKPERDDWRVTVPSASPKQDVERPEKPAENVVRLTAP